MPDNTCSATVTVTVVDNQPVCSPDPVVVRLSGGHLVFQLPAQGDWVFDADQAVRIDPPSPQFPSQCHRVNDWQVRLHDDNTRAGSHRYTVQVHHRVTGQRLRHDPTIVNDPGHGTPAAAAADGATA